MQAGDPFAPFFGALRNFNEMMFRNTAPDIAETYRRNLEAIEHANRVIMDGALEASRRQAEIIRLTMDEVAKAARTVSAGSSPMEAGAAQADVVSATVRRMQEVNEAMTRANTEALELLRDRLLAAIQETYNKAK
jgi:phasin family protein